MADKFGLKIGLEGEKEFKKSLSEINSAFKVLGSEMKLVESQFGKNDKSVSALSARHEVLEKTVEAQKNKVEMLSAALENASQSFGENDRRTQAWQAKLNEAKAELNNLERSLQETEDALEDFDDDMDDGGDSADEFGDEVEEAAEEEEDAEKKTNSLGKAVSGLSKAFAAAVAAIGAAVAVTGKYINDCVEVHAGFDDAMKGVAATMGITAQDIENGSESYAKLEQAAKDAGATTKFSASEASEALNYLALAGYDADKAVETLPKVLNLAAAGGMELATTSDLVTDAMSAMGMETSELDKFINQMAKTSQKSNTSVLQLGEAILVCAGTCTNTNQDLTTMNTALGVLADNGIKGAEGGTHLRNVLLSLSTPTDKAAGTLDRLGVSVFDAQGNMRSLDAIMGDLAGSLDNLSGEERTQAISAIFNKTDISAVNALLASTNGRFDELSDTITNCGDAATEMAETMESGLAGTTRSFHSAVEGMQIEIGSVFADMKQGIMADSTDIIRSFSTALRDANGDWGLIGKAAGKALGDLVNLFAQRLPQLVDMMLNVLGLLGQAIIDNLPAIVDAATQIIMSLVQGLIAALPQLAEGAVQLITTLAQGLIDNLPMILQAAIQVIVTIIQGIAEALPQLIPAMVKVVIQMVQTLIDNLPLILDAALQLIMGLAQGILDAIPTLIEALPEVIIAIVEFILDAIPQIIDAGIELLTSLVEALPEIIATIVEAIPQIIDGIINAVLNAIPQIIDAGIRLLVSLIQALPQIIITIVQAIPQIIDGIVNALMNNLDKIIQAGVDLFIALIENLPTIIVEICKAAPQIIMALVEAFGQLIYKIGEVGMMIVEGLWDGICSLASWLWDKVTGWITDIWDGICDFFGIASPSKQMAWVGKMMVTGLSGSIEKNGDEAVDAAVELASEINDAMEEIEADMTTKVPNRITVDSSGITAPETMAPQTVINIYPQQLDDSTVDYLFTRFNARLGAAV